MWVKVKSMKSDTWFKDGRICQPLFKKVKKRGREFMVTVDGLPDLVGQVGKVLRVWNEEDGDFLAVQFAQELMQGCQQDFWMFRPEDVEVIPNGDYMEQIQNVQVSWMKTL